MQNTTAKKAPAKNNLTKAVEKLDSDPKLAATVNKLNAQAPAKAASAPKADKAAERDALAKRIANERETADQIFRKLSESVSVPIKPLSAFAKSYRKTIPASVTGTKATPRRAAAVYIAALAGKAKLANGSSFPRKFKLRGVDYCLDNGAILRCQQAGIITYNSENESVTITDAKAITTAIRTTGFKL
mgnify:CR=1 FL=1